jgi:hypothetical protein
MAYADVSRYDPSRIRMRKPLSFKDGRTFSSENAAESAALELAKAFIDHAG